METENDNLIFVEIKHLIQTEDMDIWNYKNELTTLIDEAIDRQSVTTGCEWCEIASACEYEVTFFRDDDRWATERSLMPKFCPNCGRKLKGE